MDNELPNWKDILKGFLVLIPIVAIMFLLLMGGGNGLVILFWGVVIAVSVLFIWIFVRLCNDVHKIALAMRKDEKEHKKEEDV